MDASHWSKNDSSILKPLERLAALKAAAVLQETTIGAVADSLGVSYNHLYLVIRGDRIGSVPLEEGIAAFINQPVSRVFPPRKS